MRWKCFCVFSFIFHLRTVCILLLLLEGNNQIPLSCWSRTKFFLESSRVPIQTVLVYNSLWQGEPCWTEAPKQNAALCTALVSGKKKKNNRAKMAIAPPKSGMDGLQSHLPTWGHLWGAVWLRAAEEQLQTQPTEPWVLGTIWSIPSPLTPAKVSLLIPSFASGFALRNRRDYSCVTHACPASPLSCSSFSVLTISEVRWQILSIIC